MRYVNLLRAFYRTSIQTDMEYRADFLAQIVATTLRLLTNIGGLAIAYQYTPTIKGWSFAQVPVLLAVYYLMDGLIEMIIAPNMRAVMTQVRDGTLDFVLLKPVSAQFMASFRNINIWRLGNVVLGLALCIYTISRLSLGVGPREAVAFAVTLSSGVAVVYSVWLVLVTLTFWFVRLENIEQIIWQAYSAGRYPLEIYPAWLRATLTYAIPVAFIISVPAKALAGRLDAGAVLVATCVAVSAVTAATCFWRFGLKYYTGASA